MMSHATKVHNATLGTKKLPMKTDLPKKLFRITSKAITERLSLFPGFEDTNNKLTK
jgi:hypothetical protein